MGGRLVPDNKPHSGILRDPETKRWVTGTASPNPAGRPRKKRDILDKIIQKFYGPDCEQLVQTMLEISHYDADADFDNTPASKKRHWKAKYTNEQIFKARSFIFEHYFGKPSTENYQEISLPESTEISIKFIK